NSGRNWPKLPRRHPKTPRLPCRNGRRGVGLLCPNTKSSAARARHTRRNSWSSSPSKARSPCARKPATRSSPNASPPKRCWPSLADMRRLAQFLLLLLLPIVAQASPAPTQAEFDRTLKSYLHDKLWAVPNNYDAGHLLIPGWRYAALKHKQQWIALYV